MIEKIKEILTGKKPLIDVWHYIVGNYRYRLYYAPLFYLRLGNYIQKLMRSHIREQINYRISIMNSTCYSKGSCIACGCQTTQLQMCNKSCNKYCYPRMMNKKEWRQFKAGGVLTEDIGKGLIWLKIVGKNLPKVKMPNGRETNKHILYKETNTGYVPYHSN